MTIANFGYNIYKEISNLNFQVLKKEVIKVLDKRKKEILQAVVDEYINTAEPVSSATLVEKYGLNYSSATVRNELAELENNGYLDKPHTSSGRVPSEKGYRFYVDELVNRSEERRVGKECM